MAATIKVYVDYAGTDGTPGSSDDITSGNLRLRTDNTNTQDTTNPIPIVAAATKYSFWRHLYLKCTVAPATKVDNIKFYMDGAGFGTGITLNAGDEFPANTAAAPSSGYEVAEGTTGDTGVELVTGHSGISGVTDAFTFTSGSPLTGPSIGESGSLIDAIDEMTNYLLIQLKVEDTASPGTKTAETATFQYDEI